MHRDERVAAHVERMLAARGIDYNELNRSQALVPDACTVLFNAHGTAPACGSSATDMSSSRCRASPTRWST